MPLTHNLGSPPWRCATCAGTAQKPIISMPQLRKPARPAYPVVAHTLLLRDGRIFLLRRAATGFMDGYFCPPGGHQQPGESVSAAARRECREEAGVDPLDLKARFALPYISGRHQGLNFVFEAHAFSGEPGIGETQLFDASEWAPPDALPTPTAPWLAQALQMREGQWYRELP